MTNKTGRKRCRFGKSCSAACISKEFFCIVELGPEIAAMLKNARGLVSKRFGKKDFRGGHSGLGIHQNVAEATKLAREYNKLPKDDPKRKELRKRISDLGVKVGSVKGYDDLTLRMRSPKFDINKHYD